jgi:hypothetical protein
MEKIYERIKPDKAKEAILKTYLEIDYPYADAFIRAYEKFINPNTQIAFFQDGAKIVATNKYDNRIGIVLEDHTESGRYWNDFAAYYNEIFKEHERFSIKLGYYPKYRKENPFSLEKDDKNHFKTLKDKLEYGSKFQQARLLKYPLYGASIVFEGQSEKKKINECALKVNGSNKKGDILKEYANQIIEEYKILTFQTGK